MESGPASENGRADLESDNWLAFLPFVATLCFLSETATSNPFYERLAGMTFGIMAGLPQAFHIRVSFLARTDPLR